MIEHINMIMVQTIPSNRRNPGGPAGGLCSPPQGSYCGVVAAETTDAFPRDLKIRRAQILTTQYNYP
ncbi:MAG: hypothetical protein OEV49_07240 [candidate division Zixibacteria bacterium]|nr:hypothetical protein [candidate division Zixibacteria bacterium]MDH3937108.1 hypothetical protein [candidate division Zixibacteria bacterium]MDH4033039.1 hypothetical protein [candidate division Zixibacteria bacterium]